MSQETKMPLVGLALAPFAAKAAKAAKLPKPPDSGEGPFFGLASLDPDEPPTLERLGPFPRETRTRILISTPSGPDDRQEPYGISYWLSDR